MTVAAVGRADVEKEKTQGPQEVHQEASVAGQGGAGGEVTEKEVCVASRFLALRKGQMWLSH